jgi:hypothetical protein
VLFECALVAVFFSRSTRVRKKKRERERERERQRERYIYILWTTPTWTKKKGEQTRPTKLFVTRLGCLANFRLALLPLLSTVVDSSVTPCRTKPLGRRDDGQCGRFCRATFFNCWHNHLQALHEWIVYVEMQPTMAVQTHTHSSMDNEFLFFHAMTK